MKFVIQKKMENYDWVSTIKLDILMLKVVGLWPRNGKYSLNLYSLYAVLAIHLLITSHVVFHTVEVFMVGLNLKLLIGALYMSLTESLVLIKITYFAINSRKIKILIDTLNSDRFQPKSMEQIQLVEPDLKFWQIVHRSFAILVANTVLLFNALPILSRSTKHYKLPLAAWYPYNVKKSPNYEITFFYQFLSTSFRGLSSVSMDTFVAALNTYVSTQCTILCNNLKNLKDSDEQNFNEKIKTCVEHHKLIVRFGYFQLIIF